MYSLMTEVRAFLFSSVVTLLQVGTVSAAVIREELASENGTDDSIEHLKI